MKKAVIRIIDRHICDGEESVGELTTTGCFKLTANGCVITYDEADEEFSGCKTTLDVEDSKKVSMVRTGKYGAEMTIEKNRRHVCHYYTPYGEMTIGVYARKIAYDIGENGGSLNLFYSMDLNNEPASENELSFIVALNEREDKNVSFS